MFSSFFPSFSVITVFHKNIYSFSNVDEILCMFTEEFGIFVFLILKMMNISNVMKHFLTFKMIH